MYNESFCQTIDAQNSGNNPIDTIIIDRRNVFDEKNPEGTSWIGRFVNSLHIKTKESIIRNEILFKNGEQLNMRLVEESERNLRAMGIIGDVSIRLDTADNGNLNAVVETHDKWTLALFTSFKQDGGHRIFSIGLDESNFLGYAQGLSVHFSHNSEYADPYEFELRYSHRNFIKDHLSLQLELKNSESQRLRSMSLERLFFSDKTNWAGNFLVNYGTIRRRIYENGEEISSEDMPLRTISGWTALSFGKENKMRPGISFVHKKALSPDSSMQITDHIDMAMASVHLQNRSWIKEFFLDNLGRIEDVPVGYGLSFICGHNLNRSRSLYASFYGGIRALASFYVPDAFYISPDIFAEKYFRPDGGDVSTIKWNLRVYSAPVGAHRFFFNSHGVIGSNWPQSLQELLGSTTGLRGYHANQFTGQRSMVVNIEDRFNLDIEWWIFRFGGVVFFDSGTAWKQGQSIYEQRMHSSAGFGLRIENTKQQGPGILRIEAAYNLDQSRFSQITLTTQILFDSFTDIDYTPPEIYESMEK
ncbi:MAG: hypothetical protein JXA06_13555 [Bacteroidetes bacterium]|nr:hypothetical protein [Bacteroidota bacterium]